MGNNKEPIHRRPDLHFAWLAPPLAIVIGAGAWVGVPGLIIPMALLVFALACMVAYVFVMIPVSRGARRLIAVIVVTVFCGIAWLFWNVFTVETKVRYLNGFRRPSDGMMEVRVAVQALNKGKATSLANWKAELIDPSGKIYEGEAIDMTGESVDIQTANGGKNFYALPDCDLRFETARALQTGDSVYGIVDVAVPGYPGQTISLDTAIRITATDMLGRKITTGNSLLHDILNYNDVFACRHVEPKPQ